MFLQFINTKRTLIPAKHPVNFFCIPGGIAKLKCISKVFWKFFEEIFQPLRIEFPLRWQLKEYRSKLLFQFACTPEKFVDALLAYIEFFHMRDITASLHGKKKISRGCFFPRR